MWMNCFLFIIVIFMLPLWDDRRQEPISNFCVEFPLRNLNITWNSETLVDPRAHTHIYIILFYIIIKVAQNNSSGHKSRSAYLILILLTKPMKGWACGSTWHTSTVLFCLHYGKQNSNGCWISTSWNGASLVCRAPESDPWNYLELGESDSKSHVRGVPDHWFWFMWSKKASPGAPIEETISQPRIGPRFNPSKPSWSCCVRQMPSQQFCGADSSCCR